MEFESETSEGGDGDIARVADSASELKISEPGKVLPENGDTQKSQQKPKPNHQQPRQCKFYVEKKKRRCKIWALRHDDYCGEHANCDSKNEMEEYRRIPCPYNSNHTCYERLLDDHMKKCNFRPQVHPHFFEKGINGCSYDMELPAEQKGLRELTAKEVQSLINIVRVVHKDFIPSIGERFGIHPELATEMLRTDVGDVSLKHVSQNSSLIQLMEDHDLLEDSTCFIEFGSGRGALTYWLAQVTTKASREINNSVFLLVDKQSHRHKRENKLKDTDVHVERVRIDITDLKLDALSCMQQSSCAVGVTKHLCGAAADTALKCLLGTNELVGKVKGLVFATCCHHQCNLETYVGTKFLLEWGFKVTDFKALTGMATWAVCGTGQTRFEDESNGVPDVINNPIYAELDLSTAERRRLGIMAKEILDFGRVCYIQGCCDLDAFLCYYVDLSTTYENRAIVACKKKPEPVD